MRNVIILMYEICVKYGPVVYAAGFINLCLDYCIVYMIKRNLLLLLLLLYYYYYSARFFEISSFITDKVISGQPSTV